MAVSISLSVTQNSQSIDNNTSNVTVKVNYSWTYGSFNRDSTTKYVKINGTKYSFNDTDINGSATTSGSGTLYTKTLNIAHNSDGTGKVEVYAYVDTDISSGVLTKSTTKTLTTIPRASTISATSAVVGSASTITINRKSSSFTHTLKYSFGSLSGTIVSKTTSTSYKWTLPTTFYAQIGASATSKSGTLTCETYSGSTLVGTKTATFTAKTSSATCAPTLSPTVTDVNTTTTALTGDANKLVKYYSTAAVAFGAAARNSATLSSRKATNSGKSRTSDGNFTAVTSGDFVFTATDSRGYSTSKTITKTLINYVKLTCTQKINLLVDGTGAVNISGNYFNGSFGAVSNTLTVQYRYKESGGSYGSWITATATKSGNTYAATENLSGLDYTKTYVFESKAVDKLATISTGEKSAKALPVFDWGENDFNFNVPVFTTAPLQVQAICCGCGTAFTLPKGTAKVPLSLYTQNGNLLEVYDGGVRCVADGVVLVAGAVHVTGLTAGNTVQVEIVKSGNHYAASFGQSGTRTFLTTQLTPRVINVNAGDIIYLYAGNYQEASGNVGVNNNTIFTVIYLGGR